MNKYKPEYMGKVIPADDPVKMTNFMSKQYDSFSQIYNVCKDESVNINNIKVVDTNSNDSFSVKISAAKETISNIIQKAANSPTLSVSGDVITAKYSL